MGPVGLGGVINAVYRGARVIAVESHPYRAALAKNLGAAEVVNPQDEDAVDQIRDLTDGRGADKGVECSAASPAVRLLIDAARRKGQVALVGASGDVKIHGWSDITGKGLTLHGAWHYNLADGPRDDADDCTNTRTVGYIHHTYLPYEPDSGGVGIAVYQ